MLAGTNHSDCADDNISCTKTAASTLAVRTDDTVAKVSSTSVVQHLRAVLIVHNSVVKSEPAVSSKVFKAPVTTTL
jgi:hypothetical protein